MAEGGVPPGEVGGVIGAIVGVGGLVVGVVKWFVPWLAERSDKARETRAAGNREWEARLKEWQEGLAERDAKNLADYEQRCSKLVEEGDQLKLAVLLLVSEVARLSPTSPVLVQVRALIENILPVSFEIPAHMQASLDKLP